MAIFSYLPSLSELFSQVYADIGNPKIFWIIAFVSCLLVIHGVYVLAVVIFFHKLVNWLTAKKHITSDLAQSLSIGIHYFFFYSYSLGNNGTYFIYCHVDVCPHPIEDICK